MNLKKLLSAVGLLTVAAPATLSVVACGGPNDSGETPGEKTNLKALINEAKTIAVTAKSEVIKAVLDANQDSGLTEEDIQVQEGTYQGADYGVPGSVTIEAKNKTKYEGTVSITIDALEQIDLKDAIANKEIIGIENDTVEDAFERVLSANTKFTKEDLDYNSETFIPVTYEENGSIEVSAKENSKYEGSVIITIKQLGDLNDLIQNKEINGNEINSTKGIFQKIIVSNPNIIRQDITIDQDSFEAATYEKPGKAKIIPQKNKNKYRGEANLTITKLKDLSEQEIVDIIESKEEEHAVGRHWTIDIIQRAILPYINNVWKEINGYQSEKCELLLPCYLLTNEGERELTEEDLNKDPITIKFYFNYGEIKNRAITFRAETQTKNSK